MELRLSILPSELAVCREAPDAPFPSWAEGSLVSITRTAEELSTVCEACCVPAGVQAEGGWRAIKVAGPIPFEVTGVAAAVVGPLADAKISVFPIATFDTDYILVRSRDLDRAVEVLRHAGHRVESSNDVS